MPLIEFNVLDWLKKDVFYEKNGHKIINFATLQRGRLYKLRARVGKDVLEKRYLDRMAPDWEDNLDKYSGFIGYALSFLT